VIVLVAGSLVYVASKKQKCVLKCPSEAELVGLTDNNGLVELIHEFVTIERVSLPIIYQVSERFTAELLHFNKLHIKWWGKCCPLEYRLKRNTLIKYLYVK
jgi:hypothetical protein